MSIIGYLSGKEIKEIALMNVTECYYSTSSTYEYLGDLTAVYFVDDNCEKAHQTMLIKRDAKNGRKAYELYVRPFGRKDCYKKSQLFERIIANLDQIKDGIEYRII